MKISEHSEVQQLIADYGTILTTAAASGASLSLTQVLELLLARDAVESWMSKGTQVSASSLGKLIEYDQQLRQLLPQILDSEQLTSCRQTIGPPETSWWWFLEAPIPTHVSKWARFDWLWTTLTVVCLVGTGTFATKTIQAFSQDGMDLFQLFGTISQGAGLALVSGGALTDQGKKKIQSILLSAKIAPQFQGTATFGISAVTLLTSYGIYNALPTLGEYYYQQGNRFYNAGELAEAKRNYEESINFKPNDPDIRVALGNIYETVEEHDLARQQYQLGILQADPASLNGLGRTYLRRGTTSQDFVLAEISFRIALAQESVDKILQAELNTHLGYILLKQAESPDLSPERVKALRREAKVHLTLAIALEQQLPPKSNPGMGISHCYLAFFFQQTGNNVEEEKSWQDCAENAFPTSTGQYEDIIRYGGPQLASKIDTKGILKEGQKLIVKDEKETP